MVLRELVEELDAVDIDATIYVRNRRAAGPSSEVLVVLEPDDGSSPAEGFGYLLEVSLALEVVDVWRRWRAGAEPTPGDMCRALVFYADNDKYLPV
ncbi:hypothetical protein [Patulibacter defluvii]|uniref:hypothetical protein n=1 Tax=Patulibacter defluvii TaxID=3095358 RepID=UPI002A7634DA|nr:hypothetical protein [Patulibacter sp. DM4]